MAQDAFNALDELGVSMGELEEYGSSEGAELGRYAISTLRRVDELKEFKGESSIYNTLLLSYIASSAP